MLGTSAPGRAGRVAAVLAVLATVVAVSLSSVAHADPAEEKRKIDAKLAQTGAALEAATARAQKAAADYFAATQALPAAQAALAEARGRLAAAQAAEQQAQRELRAANDVLAAATAEYEASVVRVDAARAQVGNFVAATYKGTAFLAIDAVLESGSVSELAVRLGYLDQIAADQQRALDEVTLARQVAREKQGVAEVARHRAQQAALVAQQALAAAEAAAVSAEQAAADVNHLIAQAAEAKAIADSERGAVLTRYNELKAESDRIGDLLRNQPPPGQPPSAGPAPAPRPGAYLLMPTAGWKSSDFGWRFDPYYHVWQLHAGMDIAAPFGQAIYAAAGGRVAYAGWNGGYGNYTCISHASYQGRTLATCYAHQSRIDVSPGQSVSRGQAIGRVGSTGASTGAHLHFEVRLGGGPVNPVGWLPACLCQ